MKVHFPKWWICIPCGGSVVHCCDHGQTAGQVKVTRTRLALIRLRWGISWVQSTWVKQFYRSPLAKSIPAVLLDQSLKCWGKNSEGQLGRLDQAWQISRCLAHVFLRVYNGISGVVLRFHGLPSVMCCTFRFAGLGISLRRSLSWSFFCRSLHTNQKSGRPQCTLILFFILSSLTLPTTVNALFCSWD